MYSSQMNKLEKAHHHFTVYREMKRSTLTDNSELNYKILFHGSLTGFRCC